MKKIALVICCLMGQILLGGDKYPDELPIIDLDKLAADAQKANNGLLEEDLILTEEQWQECQALAGGAEESDPTVASNNSYCVPAPAHSFDGTGLNNARLGFTEAELEEIEKEYAKTHPTSQQALQASQQNILSAQSTTAASNCLNPTFSEEERKKITQAFLKAKEALGKDADRPEAPTVGSNPEQYLNNPPANGEKDQSNRCEHCEKCFSQLGHLRTHERIHTGEKPHVCEHCGKSFIQSTHLKLHKRTHTGEKPYVCEHCGKSFSDSSNLRKHKRIHTGEKPFSCQQCDKSFTALNGLRYHQRAAHQNK